MTIANVGFRTDGMERGGMSTFGGACNLDQVTDVNLPGDSYYRYECILGPLIPTVCNNASSEPSLLVWKLPV